MSQYAIETLLDSGCLVGDLQNCLTCYDNVLHLGCYGHCDTIAESFTPVITGTHKVTDGKSYFTVDATAGIDFQIDVTKFNENKRTLFWIEQPNGQNLDHNYNGIDYEFFYVDVQLNFQWQE